MKIFWTLLFLISCHSALAWDEAELEIFDVVEDVNQQNFYEYLGLTNEATSNEIRKAYRQLSLVLHPDKNSAEDAEIKFRWLVAIYEILKDKDKRAIYDRVLVEGLPDWRMPVFYYRRMRKMGLAEGVAYIFAIVTICQYFINWAAYWERKFTLKEALSTQSKKMIKKAKKAKDEEDISAALAEEELNLLGPKPTCFDTLPFQIFRGTKYLLFAIPSLPSTIHGIYAEAKEKKLQEELALKEEEELRLRKEEEKKERKEQRAKRKQVERYQDRTGEVGDESDDNAPPPQVDAFNQPANALQMWTDHDLAKLTRLMKKFPPGAQERWERIAEALERLPWEVTRMAKKVKDVSYQVPISNSAQGMTGLENKKMIADDCMEYQQEDIDTYDSAESTEDETEDSNDDDYGVYTVASKEEYVPVEVKTKKKTKGGKMGVDNEEKQEDKTDVAADQWSQQQQKAFELALVQFPKGTVERWDRISSKVPDKSKEQCMLRFKELAELVKKKKECQNQDARI